MKSNLLAAMFGWGKSVENKGAARFDRSRKPFSRQLRLESLEERALLAVTTGTESSFLPAPTGATMWVVNSLTDSTSWDDNDSVVTLREAISRSSNGDTITFDASLSGGTITLSGSELSIDKGISIDASTLENGIIIDGNQNSRIFYITGSSENIPVELISLTIQNGKVTSRGGGIYNRSGTLTMTNCSVVGNFVSSTYSLGGGIYNDSGMLTLTNCTVAGNYASSSSSDSSYGGGIGSSGTLTLTNSIISMNYGGNLYGSLTNSSNNLIGGDPDFVVAPEFDENGILTNLDKLDLRLKGTSWGINTGSNDAVTVETDLDGNPRIYGGTVDIGAYEYQGEPIPHEPVTYIVTTLEDTVNETDNLLSLREAITLSKNRDKIIFDSSLSGGVIVLSGTELTIDRVISIDASNLDKRITIDANQESRVFYISVGTDIPVVLINLTITGGNVNKGGGVYNDSGILTLTNCTVEENTADDGGGIYNSSGTLTLTNCSVEGNSGDGIFNIGTLTLTNCSIVGNSSGAGGGICNGGTLTLTNCSIVGNSSDVGGGILNDGTLTLTNCTVTGNSGGGIRNYYSMLTLTNSIVTMNHSENFVNYYNNYNLTSFSNSFIGGDPDFVVAPEFDENGILTNLDKLDLHLKGTSWGINAGSNDAVTVETDLDGNPRIYGGMVDIGAYEYQGKPFPYEPVTYIVTTLEDTVDDLDNLLSLREAITLSKNRDKITFDSSLSGGVIVLSGTELSIDKVISIDASNLDKGITIDGNQASRVFYISIGTDTPVELINLTITGGNANNGGGIYNDYGTLALTNCSVTGNTADDGGGIYNFYSTLTLTNCSVTGNYASSRGGGIYNFYSTLTLTNCSVVGNYASSSSSSAYGGGICNNFGTLTLTNCIVISNSVTTTSSSSSAYGGGFCNIGGELTLTNCTVAGNTTDDYGGGICNIECKLTLTNSIVSMNYSKDDYKNLYGNITNSSNNLIGGDPDFVVAPEFDENGILTNLDKLDLRLKGMSWGINAGSNDAVTVETDLDGNPRIYGGTVDIGAYEYQGEPILHEPVTYIVTTLEDTVNETDNLLSLREAIALSKNRDKIIFDSSLSGGVIVLSGTVLAIDKVISIDASNLDEGITIDGNQKSCVFYISIGTDIPVELINLTITGGNAEYGGGIYNNSGTLTLTNCSVARNSASSYGGGIYNSYGTLTLTNCSVAENSASSYGGGIYNSYGTLTLTNCSVVGNFVSSSYAYGGGIYNSYGTLTLTNCSVVGNYATSSSYSAYGGGIYNYYGTLTLYNSIILLNTAKSSGDDIYKYRSSTIVKGYNTLSSFENWDESVSTILYDPSKPLFTDAESGDYTLCEGSQAIDKGNNNFVTTETDLAGNTRISNCIVDLGAYEYQIQEEPSVIVTTLEDKEDPYDGFISLREAISYAGTTKEDGMVLGTRITFDSSLSGGTITLSGEQLTIDKAISIDASTLENGITIDGNQQSRIFNITGGSEDSPVELVNLTIQNGKVIDDNGGGIYNDIGALTLTNCSVMGNSATSSSPTYGGGIYNRGTLTLTNCSVMGNSATYGGGIINSYNGELTLTNCTIAGNSGRGIDNSSGTLTLRNSIVSMNSANYSQDYKNLDGSLTNSLNNLIGGNPDFVVAPEFDVNGKLTNLDKLDLRLKGTSWGINAGSNDVVTVETDHDGNPRIYGGMVDIGAYEYQGEPIPYESVTYIVTTLEDTVSEMDNLLSLREAIALSKNRDKITFDSSLSGGVIVLSGRELEIDKGISIDASNLDQGITIDANQESRVFYITGGSEDSPIELVNLSIRNGKTINLGGGIYGDYCTLVVKDCVVERNYADLGGGIWNYYGILTMTNCTVAKNSVRYNGGGIVSSGTLKMTNCSVTDNFSSFDYSGGGIMNWGHGTLIMINCSVTGNSAPYGGGIYSDDYGKLTMINCLVTGNSATSSNTINGGLGGGILSGGEVTLKNCTVTGNSAYKGGGIYHYYGTLAIYNSIVALNMASDSGNDIYKAISSSSEATIVNGYNTLSSFEDWDESVETILYDPSKPLFTDAESGDYTLCKGSQAIDKGNNNFVSTETDLAGNTRISNCIVDLGAYEYQFEPKVSVRVVLTDSLPMISKLAELPESIASVNVDSTVYASVWVYNADGSTTGGITGGCVDLAYSADNFTVGNVTLGPDFSLLPTYDTSVAGLVASLGGNAQLGVTDLGTDGNWVLLSIVTFTATHEGETTFTVQSPTFEGELMPEIGLTRTDEAPLDQYHIDYKPTTLNVFLRPLDTPSNQTISSYGANRHLVTWDAVENAIGYRIAYSTDQENWVSVSTTDLSYVVTGLNYGDQVYYKVKAVSNGSIWSDSDWSETKSLYVCPMDINGDKIISSADMTVFSKAYFTRPTSANWDARADIDGNNMVSGSDLTWLSTNWLKRVTSSNLTYPAPKAQIFADSGNSDLTTDLDLDFVTEDFSTDDFTFDVF